MPVYCYRRSDNGEIEEVFMTSAEMLRRQRRDGSITLDDGTKAIRDMGAEHGGFQDTPGTWPQRSDAMGVAVEQIPQARAKSIRDGVPTDFTPDGRAILTSRAHRKRYGESIGMYDRNGGYGDPRKRGVIRDG